MKKQSYVTRIVVSMLSIGVALLIGEMALRILDPYGLLRLQAETRTRYENRIPLAIGESYLMPSGRYEITDDLTFNILGDHSRLVSHSNPSSTCTLAAIGDSMTFGAGVNETENWVTLWSADNDYNIINAGRTATNAVEAAATIDMYPADGYVWFLFFNDNTISRTHTRHNPQPPSPAIWKYLSWQWQLSDNQIQTDDEAFIEAAIEIHSRDVLIFSYDDNPLLDILPDEVRGDVLLIPPHTSVISLLDAHPDAAGHQQIYDAIAPHLADYASTVCQSPGNN